MKIGILGGGQLGKMLYYPASKLDMDIRFMDHMAEGPVSRTTDKYRVGHITDYNDVMAFGQNCNVLSIEIEQVNTEALTDLASQGIGVFPQPHIIKTIQDKGLQKEFYARHSLPTSDFTLYEDLKALKEAVLHGHWSYPFVQKLRKDGYDGRGVKIIRSDKDLLNGFDAPCVVEEMVPIVTELGIITCTDRSGNVVLYDPVEMIFHPDANILLYQLAPARKEKSILEKANDIARSVSESFGIVGLLAIELFVTDNGDVLINEVAPRPHNSGHHTIEAAVCSQYENHLRAITNMPLGSPETLIPSLLMNILGDAGYSGPVRYDGINEVMALRGVHVHIYGKTDTKPYRKMGHINIVGQNYDELISKYELIDRTLKVITE